MSSPSKPTRKTNRSVTKVSYADPPDENSPSPNIERKRGRTAKVSKKKVSSKAVAKGKKKKGGNDSDSEEFEMPSSEQEEVTGSESEDEAPKKKKSKAAKKTAAKKTAASTVTKKLGEWAGWICYKAVGGGRKLSEEEAAKENAAIDEWLSGKRDDLDKLLVVGRI